MAVTVTTKLQAGNLLVVDIIASADADTTATIPHGMGGGIKRVTLIPLLQASAALSLWAATTIDDVTNVVLTKGTGVGSGNAGAQVRAYIEKLAG